MSRFKRGGKTDSLSGFRADTQPTVPAGLLKAARKSGQLNLTGRGLTEVPQNVYRLNIDTPEEANQNLSFGGSDRWWEQTDLVKLLLASNQLTTLSEDIRLLPGLTTLDLHDNQLSTLPSSLEELKQLQQLRLSHNQLSVLPVEVCSLKNLHTLTLQKNLLETLPEELGQLDNLTELDLSNNCLVTIPSTLGHLICLQRLDLSHNRLTSLPDSLAQLASVKQLDCSNNQLNDMPASLSQMSSLEQLFLRHNKLCHLPKLQAPNLKELYVGNNQIEGLEEEQLASLVAISLLELRDNKIKILPDRITLLSTLTRIDLTNNDIAILPASLSLLPNLKTLMLEGNPLRGIRRDLLTKSTSELLKYLRGRIREEPGKVDEVPTAMTLPSQARVNTHNIGVLKRLDYSEKQAQDVPDELFDAAAGEAITTINFSKNQLATLPSSSGQGRGPWAHRMQQTKLSQPSNEDKLRRRHGQRCCMDDTGLVMFQSSVSELNLGFNRLTCCSPEICMLLQLTHLDFRNNKLDELPSDMKNLTRLRSVVLSSNRFKYFPDVLYQVVSLETVLLSDNQVGGIDPCRLRQLVNLSTLDLSNNDLLNIPPELGLCTNLRCLSLQGNPFRAPRAAIVAKGTDAVLEYLRSRIPT
ncbi:leucine-rich repeat-containing protein 40 isoform X1 [Lampris incognitus]|uniref:leucine-rich repeat-containing protein 40 isoform X1 n=1 Tax=Lampris incognitus TaxID=2546036 RepID=UPI0024B4DB84|nr:leucine-rich repeat-containing protein 40 isoform X1 [Lampris incognitus]